jgi:hypothetical protein
MLIKQDQPRKLVMVGNTCVADFMAAHILTDYTTCIGNTFSTTSTCGQV